MKRYITRELNTCDEFTTYLKPTPVTMMVSRVVDELARNKLHAFELTTKIVHELVRYKPDILGYRQPEYFASPDDTLINGYGDCEDFAFTIVAVIRGLKKYKPHISYVTIGKYVKYSFFSTPGQYHAWAYADGYILEGTAGWVVPKEDPRYIPMFGIDSNRIIIIRPIRRDVVIEPILVYVANSVITAALSGAVGTATGYLISKLSGYLTPKLLGKGD